MTEYDTDYTDLTKFTWQKQEILELEKLKSKDKEIADKFNAKITEVRENIEKGWSTGDKIQDFIIYFTSSLTNNELQQQLIKLDEKLKGSAGKPVLVVSKQEKTLGGAGIGQNPFLGLDQIMKLGILQNDEFIFSPKMRQEPKESVYFFYSEMGGIQLPVEKHVVLKDRYERENPKWESIDGGIKICAPEVQNLWKKMPEVGFMQEFSGYDRLKGATHVYVGEDVELYLKYPSLIDVLLKMEDLREREEYKKAHSKFLGRTYEAKSGNKLYVEGMRLLGANPSEESKKEYDETLLNKKKYLISSLEESLYEEKMLNEKKDKSKFDIDLAVKGIKMKLKEAVELEMHKADLVIEPKQGMKIQVNEYIQGLCDKYQIDYKK